MCDEVERTWAIQEPGSTRSATPLLARATLAKPPTSDVALGQLTPEQLKGYGAELDAEERAEAEAEKAEDARLMAVIEFCQGVNARCKSEKIEEPEIAQLLRYVDQGHGPPVISVADELAKSTQSEAAERLLLAVCAHEERESSVKGTGVPPMPYERLAVLYRKAKRLDDEIKISSALNMGDTLRTGCRIALSSDCGRRDFERVETGNRPPTGSSTQAKLVAASSHCRSRLFWPYSLRLSRYSAAGASRTKSNTFSKF